MQANGSISPLTAAIRTGIRVGQSRVGQSRRRDGARGSTPYRPARAGPAPATGTASLDDTPIPPTGTGSRDNSGPRTTTRPLLTTS